MVKVINDSIFKGIAGKRPTFKPKYFVMHNDAGSMTPEQYRNWLRGRYNSGQSDKGFAHYYINRNTILRVEDTYNGTWSCANYNANMNSIGYEVCEQLKVSDAEFIENENMVLRQMAEDMLFYKMTPNSSNIKFHREFSSTSCPARSLKLHGGSVGSLRSYVITKIKYYQSLGKTVNEMIKNENGGSNVKTGWQKNDTGWWYVEGDGSYPKNKWKKINGKWYWFNGSGYIIQSKTVNIGGKQCYFNGSGYLISETKYYL